MIRLTFHVLWLSTIGACVGHPYKLMPQASDVPPEMAMALVPVVPPVTVAPGGGSSRYLPFLQLQDGPTGPLALATTNNSLNPRAPVARRGFAVCLSPDALSYEFAPVGDADEAVALGKLHLQGHLVRCDVATGNFYYLTAVAPAGSSGRDSVLYEVVGRDGRRPLAACRDAGNCRDVVVTLPALEAALGGLKLGPPGMLLAAAPWQKDTLTP